MVGNSNFFILKKKKISTRQKARRRQGNINAETLLDRVQRATFCHLLPFSDYSEESHGLAFQTMHAPASALWYVSKALNLKCPGLCLQCVSRPFHNPIYETINIVLGVPRMWTYLDAVIALGDGRPHYGLCIHAHCKEGGGEWVGVGC